jgi:hypothetical protein
MAKVGTWVKERWLEILLLLLMAVTAGPLVRLVG